jgi:hypothetical protein
VKPGPLQGQWQVVDGPVPDGAKVIVEGVEKARPGMKLDAKPWQGPPPPPPAGQTAAPPSTPAAPAAS